MLLGLIVQRMMKRRVIFLGNDKFVRNPIRRLIAEENRAIIVDEEHKTKALALAAKILASDNRSEGNIIGVFPEGTRSRNGTQMPASAGAAWLARKKSSLLIPVAMSGFWEVWSASKLLPTTERRWLAIHFLPPLDPADFADDQAAVDCAMRQAYEVVLRERKAKQRPNGTP